MNVFQSLDLATNYKPAEPPPPSKRVSDDRFKKLLNPSDWALLPVKVQRRFGTKTADGKSVLYRGVTTELKFSKPGIFLAHAARMIGAPLPLNRRSERQPAVVAITNVSENKEQIWTRLYGQGALFPQAINSTKRFSGPTGLEEHVGGGVSMSLKLSVVDGALFFSSVDYFLTLFSRRIKLPTFLSPGRMVIGHHDMGKGAFAFTLTLTHPFFGLLISQHTVFHDMEEAYND